MAVATTVEHDEQKWKDMLIGMPEDQIDEAERQIEWMMSEIKRLNVQIDASKKEAEIYAAETRVALSQLKTDLGIA